MFRRGSTVALTVRTKVATDLVAAEPASSSRFDWIESRPVPLTPPQLSRRTESVRWHRCEFPARWFVLVQPRALCSVAH